MKKKINPISIYNHLEEIILVILFAVLVSVIFLQVVMRYVFNNSLSWTEALGKLLFVWLSWMGVSIGARESEHIRITALLDKLPFRLAQIVNMISEVVVIVICAITLRYGVQLCNMLMGLGAQDAALHISQVWGYAAVPVGCGLQILRCVQSIFRSGTHLLQPMAAAHAGGADGMEEKGGGK